MTRLSLVALPLVAALPAIGHAGEINHHARIGQALRAGCTVQQVHTPAGKIAHTAPIVRCPAAKEAASVQRPAPAPTAATAG